MQTMRIENGVYLGPIGALAFEGRFSMNKRILAFLFDKLKIKIGSLPHFTINIGKKADEARTPGNTDPFFIWFYADDENHSCQRERWRISILVQMQKGS